MSNVRQLERWRVVARNDAYEVSNRGRVRRRDTGYVLSLAANSDGYLKVSLGRRCQAYAHQLVCEAWHGARPSADHVVDHIDFDRTNNRPSNLRWLLEETNRWRWSPDGWVDTHEPPDELEDPADVAEALEVLAAAGWFDVAASS